MKKIVYTACAKGVFNSSRGYQIYTCSNTYSEEERDVIVRGYIEGAKEYVRTTESPVRNIYTKDDKLGYLFLQAKPSGVDYSSGRSGNVLWQVLSDCGNASIAPMEVIRHKKLFEEAIEPAKLKGEVEPTFLPEYPALPIVNPIWKQLDPYFEAGSGIKQRICDLMDAMVDCLNNGKQLIICADGNVKVEDLLRCALMCLPSCIAKKITFDTYAYTPKKCKETVLGVYNDTDYFSADFQDTEKYVLMDFKNNVNTYTDSGSFYKKYIHALKGNFSVVMERISALCEQEMADYKGEVDYQDFLNSMAYIFYFLNYDAQRLFAEGAEGTRKKVLDAGTFVQKYHSPALMEKTIARMRELLGASGDPKFFAELKPIVSGNKELYKQYKTQIENVCYEAVYSVLQKGGMDETVAFYEKLEDALSESERAELSEQILKLLFEMTPVSSKFITAKDATIETVIDWLAKSQEHAGKCVSWFEEYFDKNASPKVFDFLINIFGADFRKRHKEHFDSLYQNLIFAISDKFLDDAQYLECIVKWNKEFEPSGKKVEKSNLVWTKHTADCYLRSIRGNKKLSLGQRQEIAKRVFMQFSAWDANYLFEEFGKMGSEIADYVSMPYVESCYQAHEDELYLAYNEIPKNLLNKLFQYVVNLGEGVYACVELMKSNFSGALKTEIIVAILFATNKKELSSDERVKQADKNIDELISLISKAKKEETDSLIKKFAEGMYFAVINNPSIVSTIPAVQSFYKKFEKKICELKLPEATLLLLFAQKTSLLFNDKARRKKIETGVTELAEQVFGDVNQMRVLEQRGVGLTPVLKTLAKDNEITLTQETVNLLCGKFNIGMDEFLAKDEGKEKSKK